MRRKLRLLALFSSLALLAIGRLEAVAAAEPVHTEASVPPSFSDPGRSLPRPDLGGLKQLRFVTEDDYPPFNFVLPDGELTGFNVELARAICEELELACTIQRRKWELLIPALNENAADAVVASMASTPENREQVDFTEPYYLTPGRFVALKSAVLPEATPEGLDDRKVAVVAGSTHEAYLKTFFPKAQIVPFETVEAARAALKTGRVNALFGDAISLAFWLNGADADGCCVFKSGPYLDSRFFGEGVGVAVKKGADPLRRALDYALARLAKKGVYSELYLKWFPIGPF
ncbi:transporter substrate-binding domain-containing protein [Methylocystis bryophila]|nr:transporter substrate-binding domain-containing protein [Methylocystis bryophila]BDV39790.1 ABC transporter substrate-binding protein [Methylocystis bryophila]